ncbi:nucleotidyltransferase [Hymenobacter sediminis]|uniref:nucleotidyltransferase domain-containing protein n=1 Tax=Hymenobacter sediminis TaxID=2218621 RepID=UPI000DA68C6C|nr:nucleotidyltransferase [Hymenobacter sediminis]RPD43908.1 nucleotidyltransferase [Hymenobacter sediminis]
MAYPNYAPPADTPAQQFARKQELYTLLDRLGQELEIPPGRYKEAEEKYVAVSEVLHGCPTLSQYDPHVFAQGSFALGTTVRPLHGDEYDLDFICYLQKAHHLQHTQRQVYDYLHKRLAGHGVYSSMVELKNRCVRIRYADKFHLDITPAVRNPYCNRGGLYVPDRKLVIWKASHPKGYVEWFTPIAALKPRLKMLEKAIEGRHVALGSTEKLPEQQVPRGILRRAVQFMKRHRDTYREQYPTHADYAPISIIITTLAAHAYQLAVSLGEYDSEFDVMNAVIDLMPRFIGIEQDWANKRIYTVLNPTTDGENFADKWSDPKYYEVFTAWHQAAKHDLRNLESLRGRDEIQKSLRNSLGGTETDRVFGLQTQSINQARQQQTLNIPAAARTGMASAAAALPVPRNNFFGK